MKKYLVITGASKGIGKSIASLFQREQWSVINISRLPCDIAGVENFPIDLSQANWPEKHATSLKNKLNHAQQICLVHNACAYHKDSTADLPADVFRRVLETNLVAPSLLNQLLIPLMPAGSSIIYIGSTLAEKAVKNAASYVVSKHAMIGMMRATCQDLAEQRIHTCCVCPGFTDTEMLRSHLNNDADILASITQNVAGHRLIAPAEIANVVWFSANNPVINGSVMHANLGQIEQ